MTIQRITYPGAMWLASVIYGYLNQDIAIDVQRFTVSGNYNTETEITIDADDTTNRRIKEINTYIDFDVNPAQAGSYIDFYRTDGACVGETDRIGQIYYAASTTLVLDASNFSTEPLKALIRTYTDAVINVYFVVTYYYE